MSNEKPLSGVEKLKEASRGLRGSLAAEVAADTGQFTKEGAQLLKFHGSYQQEDRDLRRQRTGAENHSLMVRCKIPGGVLTADQYLALDDLASRYANGTLRVTTRQDNQFHGVLKGDLKATIRALNDALITTLGACGDVNRNVLSCPAPVRGGLHAEVLDVARRISDRLLPRTRAYHEIWLDGEQVAGGPGASAAPEDDPLYGQRYLPRKFKVAIAFPDDNCTDVLSNDLGFLVIRDGDRLAGFNVLVGGGLGMTHGKEETYPRLADPLGFATAGDVIDVAVAVVLVQRDHGNRSDRRRARLKYLLDERGLDWFRTEVEQRLGRPLPPPAPVEITGIHDHLGWHDQGDGRGFFGLFVENGRIKDDEHGRLRSALRSVVETYRPGVHFTPQQNVLLTDLPHHVRAAVEGTFADRVSTVRRWSMACPAMPTCGLAIAEAERALPGVIDELEREMVRVGIDPVPFTVRMTGCPNGCARPYTADIAFVGRALDKYTVFVGGNLVGTRLAVPYADLVPRNQLVKTVLPLLERYRDEHLPGEGFGDFWHRTAQGAEVGA